MKGKRKTDTENEFEDLIHDLEADEKVLEMKKYKQHGKVSTYDHCRDVARVSHRLAKLFHAPVNKKEMIRGAFLHDYFLYDWHHHEGKWHGFTHPGKARQNAEEDFELTSKEKNIIESHMWPLTPTAVPKNLEAVLVNLADKICSTKETLFKR